MAGFSGGDSSQSLRDLSPVAMFPYAIYIPAFDPYGRPHFQEAYRRYRTKGHMKSAATSLRKVYGHVTTYEFDFDNENWEELND